ncbi:MAG TPA: asparagine synthase (glutamine-hydrolyzing) [Syntrophales bacterium]|nr:asparagine synthase (glutamine-hydrolyzing) [Syntrophales bacterium]
MCGICGIIDRRRRPVAEQDIVAMCRLVSHRGPDAEGIFIRDNVALGHRRLKIIDLSDAANQPFHYGGRYVLTYNGEIYNYPEIREELKRERAEFKTESDTEVLLAAYDRWGFDCVQRFNGMWAFALYDAPRRLIFCSRDRFGVKPFYYATPEGKFVFGSEIKQLLFFMPQPTVNIPILLDYLVSGYEDHTSETFFKDIHTLSPGHNLLYDLDGDGFRIVRYYELSVDERQRELPFPEAVRLFRSTFDSAVAMRLRSDVRVGTCLSGGTDSSAVASVAAGLYRGEHPFAAITAGSVEKATDERYYAELVARAHGLEWHVIEPSVADFGDNLDEIIYSQEEPFGSPSVCMQERVFHRAKEAGCIVMLDGQGGDETLLGYERYYPAYIRSLPTLRKIGGFLSAWKCSRLSLGELAFYLLYFTSPSIRVAALRHRHDFVKKGYFDFLGVKHIYDSSKAYGDIDTLQRLEIGSLQLPHLLRYEDRNSMRHGVESRLPFLDYRLVELSLSLPNDYKIREGWTKYILRKATQDIVPAEVAWRRHKVGFNAPERTWMKAIADRIFASICSSMIIEKITDKKALMEKFAALDLRTRWRLFNIARWEELYNIAI